MLMVGSCWVMRFVLLAWSLKNSELLLLLKMPTPTMGALPIAEGRAELRLLTARVV